MEPAHDDRTSHFYPNSPFPIQNHVLQLISPRVMETEFLTDKEKAVFIVLCHHIDERGCCTIGCRELAEKVKTNEKHVRSILARLIHTKLVEVVRGGQGVEHIYRPIRY